MDRNLTDEELEGTEIGKIINRIGCFVDELIEKGYLKDCEMYYPLICDEEPLELVNGLLNMNAEFMYYIPISGNKKKILQDGSTIKDIVKIISEEYEGHVFKDHKKILHINSLSFMGEEDNTAHHNILILIKCDIDPESDLIN